MRTAGIIALIGFVVVLGASVVASRVGAWRSVRPDVFGTVELYGNGSLVIETPTAGLREVGVSALTVVRDMDGQGDRPVGAATTLADLRPGRSLALWLRDGLSSTPVAREIDVWGKGR